MKAAGIAISIIGGFIALLTSAILGLIVLGLGLILISLNKNNDKKVKVEVSSKYEEKKSGYFYWSRTKLGKWSMPLDAVVLGLISILLLVSLMYVTSESENEDLKNVNCGLSDIFTSSFLYPIFNYDGMYEKFCGQSKDQKFSYAPKLSPQPSPSVSSADYSWVPSGFNFYGDDVAWRWAKKSEFMCKIGDSCWGMFVVTKNGCPTSLYAEINIFDSAGTQVGYTNEVLRSLAPKVKGKLIFDSFEEDADSAQIGKISCY